MARIGGLRHIQDHTGTTAKERRVQVLVRDNNVDQALKALKKKMQREGIFREMKLRGHYEKPSEKKAREKAEAIRRARKLARKRMLWIAQNRSYRARVGVTQKKHFVG